MITLYGVGILHIPAECVIYIDQQIYQGAGIQNYHGENVFIPKTAIAPPHYIVYIASTSTKHNQQARTRIPIEVKSQEVIFGLITTFIIYKIIRASYKKYKSKGNKYKKGYTFPSTTKDVEIQTESYVSKRIPIKFTFEKIQPHIYDKPRIPPTPVTNEQDSI